jgi:hypothetical protein
MPSSDISKDLAKIMAEYTDSVKQEISEIVEDVGNEATAMLKGKAPRKKGKGGGKYRRSITVELSQKKGNAGFTVYAKAPHYRLTHLLENSRTNEQMWRDYHAHLVARQIRALSPQTTVRTPRRGEVISL